jgi:6-phosphogluconate dehydrogenase
MEPKGDIALIGLAVMGQNLILNMSDHGYTVVAYNRTVSTTASSERTRSRRWWAC